MGGKVKNEDTRGAVGDGKNIEKRMGVGNKKSEMEIGEKIKSDRLRVN